MSSTQPIIRAKDCYLDLYYLDVTYVVYSMLRKPPPPRLYSSEYFMEINRVLKDNIIKATVHHHTLHEGIN